MIVSQHDCVMTSLFIHLGIRCQWGFVKQAVGLECALMKIKESEMGAEYKGVEYICDFCEKKQLIVIPDHQPVNWTPVYLAKGKPNYSHYFTEQYWACDECFPSDRDEHKDKRRSLVRRMYKRWFAILEGNK